MVKFNVRVMAGAALALVLGAAAPVTAEESVTVEKMGKMELGASASSAGVEESSNKRKLWMLATTVAKNPSTMWTAPAEAEKRQLYDCNTMWSCVMSNGFLNPACGMTATAFLVKVVQCWSFGWRRSLRGVDAEFATATPTASEAEEASKPNQRKLASCSYLWSCLDSNWMLKPSCGMTATEFLVHILGCF